MKRFGVLLVLAAIALGLYNLWQISLLRGEIASARRETRQVREQVRKPDEAQALIRRAREHAAKANRLIANGEHVRAKVELQRSLEALRKAGAQAGKSSQLESTFSSLKEKMEGMLQELGSGKGQKQEHP